MSEAAALTARLEHVAVVYDGPADYAGTVGGFVRAGLENGEPVMVAVPTRNIALLADYLADLSITADQLVLVDMGIMGVNPGRIMSRVGSFFDAHQGRAARYVGEPIWQARSAAELAEATRHEALINLAFSGLHAAIMCPYDARLSPATLALAEQTHPVLLRAGRRQDSTAYLGPAALPPACDGPLPEPPADAASLGYRRTLAEVRELVAKLATAAGLADSRVADLVIAVGELAANTLRHTAGEGTVRVWSTPAEVICEVHDGGHIRDALAGRRQPDADARSGHGLWVVHQLCDLVEMRTGSAGTTIRLHMGLSA
jgi:anti-sigma regulatory factor (Ser/Thr protein kinase)